MLRCNAWSNQTTIQLPANLIQMSNLHLWCQCMPPNHFIQLLLGFGQFWRDRNCPLHFLHVQEYGLWDDHGIHRGNCPMPFLGVLLLAPTFQCRNNNNHYDDYNDEKDSANTINNGVNVYTNHSIIPIMKILIVMMVWTMIMRFKKLIVLVTCYQNECCLQSHDTVAPILDRRKSFLHFFLYSRQRWRPDETVFHNSAPHLCLQSHSPSSPHRHLTLYLRSHLQVLLVESESICHKLITKDSSHSITDLLG